MLLLLCDISFGGGGRPSELLGNQVTDTTVIGLFLDQGLMDDFAGMFDF